MTVYNGLLLLDMAEPSINNWENQLGWRGYYEEWKNSKGESFWMEVDEDIPADTPFDCTWDLLWRNGDGDEEFIGAGTFGQVDMMAKLIMAVHSCGRPSRTLSELVSKLVLVDLPALRGRKFDAGIMD